LIVTKVPIEPNVGLNDIDELIVVLCVCIVIASVDMTLCDPGVDTVWLGF
jgi:hypothetical protein